MKNQPRDVTGGDAVLSGFIPGLGLFNYFLAWLSVPAEVFLRRNFGERYFTKANCIAGLIVLVIFRFASSLIGMLNPMSWFSSSPSVESWMGSVIKYYIYFSIAHFLRIWWNDITGNHIDSYSSGRSWLRPIGKLTMGFMNIFLNAIVHLLFKIIPNSNEKKLANALPVLRDVDTFTERFIEPCTVFFFAIYCSGAGQTSMFFWLLFSVMALNFSTSARHEAQRSFVLDFRDQGIHMKIIHDALNGVDSPESQRMKQFIDETANEAEKNPDIMQVIQRQHPTLADAIAATNAKQKKEQSENSITFNTPANASII